MAAKTGLAIDALIPPKPEKKTPATKPKAKRPQKEKTKSQAGEEKIERRTTWIREDYYMRLEELKVRERKRLLAQKIRVSVVSLIDEALAQYLDKMGV